MFSSQAGMLDADAEARMEKQIQTMETEANATLQYAISACAFLYVAPHLVDFAFKLIPA